MMKTFERPMRKDFDSKGKLKQYLISLGVKSEINEDKFYKNDNGKMVCDVIICFPDDFEKLSQEHKEFQSQIQTLKNEIEAKNKSIKSLQNRLSSIDEDHEEKIKNLKEEHSAKVDKLNDDLHGKDLEIERRIGDLKAEYEHQIGDLKERTQKDLNKLKLYDKDNHMSIIDHQKEISDLKEKHQKEMNDLKLFDEEKHMNITDHLSEFNEVKDSIARQTIRYNDKINDLENSLKFTSYIRGHPKSKIKELKEGLHDFEMIGKYIESKDERLLQEVKDKKEE